MNQILFFLSQIGVEDILRSFASDDEFHSDCPETMQSVHWKLSSSGVDKPKLIDYTMD